MDGDTTQLIGQAVGAIVVALLGFFFGRRKS